MQLILRDFGRLMVAALVSFVTPAVAMQDTPREIAREVSPSVVLLVMEDANGQPLSIGSGFVVREGVVATNMHVIEGAARGYAKLADEATKHDIKGVVASDAVRDLALLSVDGLKAKALPIGDSDAVAVGDAVYAVGNPRGLEGTFSAGIVSSIRKAGDDSLLQITAPISPGSSGGPVVSDTGEVVGVAVATYSGGQNLNFAIPCKYLSALMPTISPPVTLPAADEARQASPQESILDGLGGQSTDGVQGDQFIWTYSAGQTGDYSLSLRNQLREHVRDVVCLVVFYDSDGSPIDIDFIQYRDLVPAGLAERVTSRVDGSVQKLTTRMGEDVPHSRVELRILHFDIVSPDQPIDQQDPAPWGR